MPTYDLKCPKCGREKELIRVPYILAAHNLCECGTEMKIQIGKTSFRIRHGRPDVIQWKKEKGVLDEIP